MTGCSCSTRPVISTACGVGLVCTSPLVFTFPFVASSITAPRLDRDHHRRPFPGCWSWWGRSARSSLS